MAGLQSSAGASFEGLKSDATVAAAAADKENGGAANMEGLPGSHPEGTETPGTYGDDQVFLWLRTRGLSFGILNSLLPTGETTTNAEQGKHGVKKGKDPATISAARTSRGRAAAKAAPAQPEPQAEPPEPTEYARNRPRRDVQGQKAMLGHTTESLELVKCMDFVGPPGSGAPLAQPFQVHVQAQVTWASPPLQFLVAVSTVTSEAAPLVRHGDVLLCS